jgi:glycerate dehydrogenase
MTSEQPKIVFLDAATYGDIALDRFTRRWNCSVHQVTSPGETVQRVADHSIVVTNKVVIDKAVLHAPSARSLKLIAVAATGTDIIDREEAARRGVKVCNVPGYASQSVAQFTLALILQLATNAGKYGAAVKAGEWQKSPVFSLLKFPTIELAGKKLGIVGYGSIGKTVAHMARALGMEILVAARPGTEGAMPDDRMALTDLLRESDVVSLHCPLTPETRNLINARTLALMKPSSFLINTARGALIDENTLIEALRDQRIAGAALDVISQEPPAADHPMIVASAELENLFITPHTAWSARESRERLLHEVEENIAAFWHGIDRNRIA